MPTNPTIKSMPATKGDVASSLIVVTIVLADLAALVRNIAGSNLSEFQKLRLDEVDKRILELDDAWADLTGYKEDE